MHLGGGVFAALNRLSRQVSTPISNLHAGFTLAEVLITLVIVGVVAALTIPTLAKNINRKVKEHQIEVITKRFEDGLKLYSNQDSAFSGITYKDTEDFLNGLSKHFKMVKICGSDNIQDCIPYTQIKYDKSETQEDTVKVRSLSTPEKLGLKSKDFYNPAAFITAGGTPYIVALKKNCFVDPDSVNESPMNCIDGIYDYNGSRLKNKFGDDIRSINTAKVGATCISTYGGLCIIKTAFTGSPVSRSECESLNLGGGCYFDNDYWAGAMVMCQEEGGHIPSMAELAQIATLMYGRKFSARTDQMYNLDWSNKKDEIFQELGISSSNYAEGGVFLWSSEPSSSDYASGRWFFPSKSYCRNSSRSTSYRPVFCLAD